MTKVALIQSSRTGERALVGFDDQGRIAREQWLDGKSAEYYMNGGEAALENNHLLDADEIDEEERETLHEAGYRVLLPESLILPN